MIITKQKELKDLLNRLNDKSVFIVGCSECATVCHTGGEKEVLAMKDVLQKKGVNIVGWVVLDPACNLNNDKRLLKKHIKELDAADKVLVLACGSGVQTVSEVLDKEVIAGIDTLFLGEIKRVNEFEKRCVTCGVCELDFFEDFCPVSRCPKSMLNGPCGGSVNGKCEVNKDMDCVWSEIFSHLKEKGRLHKLKCIVEPKDWSNSVCIDRRL
ncbi:MAG: methylenetetrahydrofolate reductase C-terminal domain-containing protein [Candidatus Thermoplasmatota archaeon]|nr:methylenetetrahydrofolate reductase C-terminal domain-containing protein [Candidatus Thermoplasmatota archaeon]